MGRPADWSRACWAHLDEAGEEQHGVQDQAHELASPSGAQPQIRVQQHRQPEYEEGLLQRLQGAHSPC